jgi:hypothetical protein
VYFLVGVCVVVGLGVCVVWTGIVVICFVVCIAVDGGCVVSFGVVLCCVVDVAVVDGCVVGVVL